MFSCDEGHAPITVQYAQFPHICADCRIECLGDDDVADATCQYCGADMDAEDSAPRVDDLATITLWSDRTPARVIKVSPSGHQVILAELDAKVVSGSMVDGSAKYAIGFRPRADAVTQVATRRGDGTYRLKGWSQGGRVSFGFADAYRDPSF